MKLLILFILLNVANVIIQTVKSIATIKCGKVAAALVNAIAYGLYTIVIVYTNCELNLWVKVAVVGVANLIGVYIVKYFEERSRKDCLWKVEATVLRTHLDHLHADLVQEGISHNYIDNVGKYVLFNIYCPTQKESAKAKKIMGKYNAKYFVSESKTLY